LKKKHQENWWKGGSFHILHTNFRVTVTGCKTRLNGGGTGRIGAHDLRWSGRLDHRRQQVTYRGTADFIRVGGGAFSHVLTDGRPAIPPNRTSVYCVQGVPLAPRDFARFQKSKTPTSLTRNYEKILRVPMYT